MISERAKIGGLFLYNLPPAQAHEMCLDLKNNKKAEAERNIGGFLMEPAFVF